MKEKVCIYTYCKINKRDLITYQKPKQTVYIYYCLE